MRIIKCFRKTKPVLSAQTAKDRLHIIIEQERSQKGGLDFLPLLRQDILAAIAKYTHVDIEQVKVDLSSRDNNSVLELNVTLPDLSTDNRTRS